MNGGGRLFTKTEETRWTRSRILVRTCFVCLRRLRDFVMSRARRYFVAPLMTASGSTTVDTPAAFMMRSSAAAVCFENRKFMPR